MNKLVSFFGRQWNQFNISSTLETCHRVNCPCVEELSRTFTWHDQDALNAKNEEYKKCLALSKEWKQKWPKVFG